VSHDLAGLEAFAAGLDAAVEKGLDVAAASAARGAASRTHGELAASIAPEKTGPFERAIGSSLWFARIVEKGRKGIQAKSPARTRLVRALLRLGGGRPRGKARLRVLCFVAGGRLVFARRVGPAPARPFMQPAAAELRSTARATLEAALSKLLSGR
jgi:hypothetical protein